jgi:type II secretory pathway pseudopilin PulG
MSRSLRRYRTEEEGLSLVELLTVMVIFGIVGTLLTSSFISAERTLRNTNALAADVNEARASMVEVSRVIRTARPRTQAAALPFADASASQLTFYANFRTGDEPGPKLIRLTVEDDQFIEYIQPAFGIAGSPGFDHDDVMTGTRRILANNVTTTDIFTYTDREGDEVDPMSATGNPIIRVAVRLEIGGPPVRPTPTVVNQTIRLPNIIQS